MRESLGRWLELAVGLVVSVSALVWLMTLQAPREGISRIGFISALWCVGLAVAYCEAVILAFVMRNRRLPARYCTLAALRFAITGLAISWTFIRLLPDGMMLTTLGFIASNLTRRLAYPNLTEEQVFAPEPTPTLFPR
jgi:hypothetical protein